MTLFLMATAGALAQGAADFSIQPGALLEPSDLTWGLNTTVGSPAVARYNPSGNRQILLMFYETQTAAASKACPAGEWGVGLAYLTNNSLAFADAGAIVSPGSSFYTCVAAHPAVVQLDADTFLVYFKAELDESTCTKNANFDCVRYPGIGRVVVDVSFSSNTLTVTPNIDSSPVLEDVAQNMGYPSVMFEDGEYHMVYAEYPDLYLMSSPFSAFTGATPSVTLSAGAPATWGDDELFSASILCEGTGAYKLYPGGRIWNTAPTFILDQSVGLFESTDLSTWSETNKLPYFSTQQNYDPEFRHMDVISANSYADYAIYFSSPVGGGNSIFRAETNSYNWRQMDNKRCP